MGTLTATLDRLSPRGRCVLRLVTALVLAIYFFAPATEVMNVNLDSSNYASYAAFTAAGRQYGTEVIPMAGPFGFILYGFTYSGDLYWTRYVLEFAVKFSFALLVLWLFTDARSRVVRWVWLASLLLILSGGRELTYDFTVLLAGLFVVLNANRPERQLASRAAMVVLALLALTKGTLMVFGVATLGVIALQAIVLRDIRRLAWFVGIFVVALAAFWLAAGQGLSHVPAFLRGLNELSTGYNNAMGLQEPLRIFVTGAGTLVLLLFIIAAVAWTQRRQLPIALAMLLMAGFSFLKWKHGFVRADGHFYLFYLFAEIGVLMIWLVGRTSAAQIEALSRAQRTSLGVVVGFCALLAFYGPGGNPFIFLGWQLQTDALQLRQSVVGFFLPRALQRQLAAELAANRQELSLPRLREIVGAGSVDFFGTEHGYIPLNSLNHHPRPMSGGSFNVFTPELQRRNEQFVSAPETRPDFFLVDLVTIDNRLLPEDDASTLRAVLYGYEPVAVEQGVLLLRARRSPSPGPIPRVIGKQEIKFGDAIVPPTAPAGEMLLVSFDFKSSWIGRLRAALYKPSAIYFSMEGDSIHDPESRRLIPSMVESPVILSPLLEDNVDFLALYGPEAGKRVWKLWIYAQLPSCFESARITFYSAPRPPRISRQLQADLLEGEKYPMANRLPQAVLPSPAVFRMKNGFLVQRVVPPGNVEFPMTGSERSVDFCYGLDPECYAPGHVTDGVDFFVELRQPGGPVQLLGKYSLHPFTTPADRGTHEGRLFLPAYIKPGSKLSLRTGPGDRNDTAWDWAYLSKIHLNPGPLVAEQFPGFSTVPAEVEADYCGALFGSDQEKVFMLNAPGRVTFALTGDEKTLVFHGGIMAGAYTEGDTDGAEFVVELKRANGRNEELLRRWLRPKTVPADRGAQVFKIALPEHRPGDRLDVRTTGGPAGNLAWDWTYLEGLDLH